MAATTFPCTRGWGNNNNNGNNVSTSLFHFFPAEQTHHRCGVHTKRGHDAPPPPAHSPEMPLSLARAKNTCFHKLFSQLGHLTVRQTLSFRPGQVALDL